MRWPRSAVPDPISSPRMGPTGRHIIVVFAPKGGVGKTTVAAGIAQQLAAIRGETVAVIDANLHRGTLRQRTVPGEVPPPLSFVELCRQAPRLRPEWPMLVPFHDLVGRLRVFGNDAADPAAVEALDGPAFMAGVDLVARAAQIVVLDMGTSAAGPVIRAALGLAGTVVAVADRSADSLELLIEWVSALAGSPQSFTPAEAVTGFASVSDGRYAGLVPGLVIALNPSRTRSDVLPRDQRRYLEWLNQACGHVVSVPRDPQVARGDVIDWDTVSASTLRAFRDLAGWCAARFPLPPREWVS